MTDYRITCNNTARLTVNWWDLSNKEKKEFDYIKNPEDGCGPFVRYRGWVYDLRDTARVETGRLPADTPLRGWHCYVSDYFFSTVLFKYKFPNNHDMDSVICATMTC